jgi:hypothetical protein
MARRARQSSCRKPMLFALRDGRNARWKRADQAMSAMQKPSERVAITPIAHALRSSRRCYAGAPPVEPPPDPPDSPGGLGGAENGR